RHSSAQRPWSCGPSAVTTMSAMAIPLPFSRRRQYHSHALVAAHPLGFVMFVFRQLFDPASSTYTYLLADGKSGAAVVIDPVFEQVRRDAALIDELGLKLLYSLETHVHADHVTGAWLLRRQTGCHVALSADSGAEGADRYLVDDDVIAFGER